MTLTRTPLLRKTPLRPGKGLKRSRLTLKTKTDPTLAAWSLYVLTRYGFTCQRCGRSKAQGYVIQAAHILGRGAQPRLKYHPDNGIALCAIPCHRWYDQHKGSKHDGEADLWVRAKIGEDQYTRLLIYATIERRPDPGTARLILQARLQALQRETP